MYSAKQSPQEIVNSNRQLEAIFHRYGIDSKSDTPLENAVGNPDFLIGLLSGSENPEKRNKNISRSFLYPKL